MSKRRSCFYEKTESKILLHCPFKLGHLTLPHPITEACPVQIIKLNLSGISVHQK